MKQYLKKVWYFIKTSTLLKYAVVAVIAIVFIGFADENSIWSHFRNKQTINNLEEEIDHYNAQHEENQNRIKQLDKDPKAIQKIARERYYMKADDEDIFILSDDEDESTTSVSNEATE
jgi:cell division protein FtsB